MAQVANNAFPPLPEELVGPSSAAQLADDGTLPGPPGFPGLPGPPLVLPQLTTFRLKKGTWLFNYSKTADFDAPLNFALSDGTFRFEGVNLSTRASGDMYGRPLIYVPRRKVGLIWIGPFWLPGPAPPKDQGIPILMLNQYQAYLRVTAISIFLINNNSSFDMEFEKYQWDKTKNAFATDATGKPVVEGTYVARMTFGTAPAGWPSSTDFLTGEVKVKSSGVVAGYMRMGWVSDKWRKIGLEIDAVKGCNFPLLNNARQSIWNMLENNGFQVVKRVADENQITDTPNSVWTDAALHQAMLDHRQTVDLNNEWTYHALMIPQYTPGVLGIMYDDVAWGSDTNKVAREGFAVAAHLMTGEPARWGTEANRKLQDALDSFMRTTIHELAHAMGMQHPDAYSPVEVMDQTFTCQTWSLLQHAETNHLVYPSNIQWRYSPTIEKRLRHYPDIRIRPGGVAFSAMAGTNGAAPWVSPNDTVPQIPGFTLEIKPLLSEVPLGAPVRVEVILRNDSEFELEVPRDISLKGEALKGDVENVNGVRRPFNSFIQCDSTEEPLTTLEPGQTKTTSVTLFGGTQSPLFPSTGIHAINVNLCWSSRDHHGNAPTFWLDAKTTVMVTGVRSASHAAAAHRVLTEPQTQLSVVLAGDHLTDGVEAIQQALADETLGPHYACIEARRCASRFQDRHPDIDAAKKLIGRKGCVMSGAEKAKMDRLFKRG